MLIKKMLYFYYTLKAVSVLAAMAVLGFFAEQAVAETTRIKVASFNVKLMQVEWENGRHSYTHLDEKTKADRPAVTRETRLDAMVKVTTSDFTWGPVDSQLSGFDVIGYQEVWRLVGDAMHFDDLRERLVDNGFKTGNIVRGTGKGLGENGWNHGLVIASRFPVLETAELKFWTAKGWDWFAEKGALFARIDVNGIEVAVFNTHLQADDQYGSTRAEQLKILRDFIKEHAGMTSAVIVMGDLNFARKTREQCKTQPEDEYCSWRKDAANYGDWSGFVDNGPTNEPRNKWNSRLDYILTGYPHRAAAVRENDMQLICVNSVGFPEECDDAGELGAVTDHPMVFGEYEIKPGNIFECYSANSVRSAAAGDFNGDGKDDLAVAYDYGGNKFRMHVFLSTGAKFAYQGNNGWWGLNKTYAGSSIRAMVAGDFNGDGKDDLAVAYDYGGNKVRMHVFQSTGTGFTYQGNNGWWGLNKTYAGSSIRAMTAGDFNGDGKDDLAVAYDYGGLKLRMHAFLSTGTSFAYQGNDGWWGSDRYAGSSMRGLVAGDFDGDGTDDLATPYDYGKNRTSVHAWLTQESKFDYQGNRGWWGCE